MSWWNDPSKFGSIMAQEKEPKINPAFPGFLEWLIIGQPSPPSSDAAAVKPSEEAEPKKDPLRNIVGRY